MVRMNPIHSIVLKRLMIGLLTLWIVTVIIFAAVKMLPGDIATEKPGQAAGLCDALKSKPRVLIFSSPRACGQTS